MNSVREQNARSDGVGVTDAAIQRDASIGRSHEHQPGHVVTELFHRTNTPQVPCRVLGDPLRVSKDPCLFRGDPESQRDGRGLRDKIQEF